MSYLINQFGDLIATTQEKLQSGNIVYAAYRTVPNHLDANRDQNLFNAQRYKVSNAKKYDGIYCDTVAVAINNNDNEFLLKG